MAILKRQPPEVQREKGPDVVGALREWVGQDHRIATTEQDPIPTTELERDRTDASSNPQRTDPDQLRRIQSFQNLSDPDGGRGLSASADQNADEFHPAPPIHGLFEPDPHEGFQTASTKGRAAATDPGIDPERHAAASRLPAPRPQHQDQRAFKPSVTSRVWHTVVHGFIAVAIACVVFAILSNKDIIQQRGDPVLSSAIKSQASQPSVANELAPVLQQQLALQRQLETMANELAAMRHIADRLAARQEEMTQNIATLQSSEQNIRQQVAALIQTRPQNSATQSRRHRHRAYAN